MNENRDMAYQCLLREVRLSPRSYFAAKFICLPKDQMRILDWLWRWKESHALFCGQLHYTRRSIGVGMAVEAIATWDQRLNAGSITRLRGSSPSGQKLRSDWMNQLHTEGGKCIHDGMRYG